MGANGAGSRDAWHAGSRRTEEGRSTAAAAPMPAQVHEGGPSGQLAATMAPTSSAVEVTAVREWSESRVTGAEAGRIDERPEGRAASQWTDAEAVVEESSVEVGRVEACEGKATLAGQLSFTGRRRAGSSSCSGSVEAAWWHGRRDEH